MNRIMRRTCIIIGFWMGCALTWAQPLSMPGIVPGCSSCRQGLISYWKLDESSGNAIDAYNGFDGTVTGAIQNVTGKINTAYDFDGDGDFVNVGDIDVTGEITIAAWIELDIVPVVNPNIIVAKRDDGAAVKANYAFDVKNGTDELRFYLNPSTGSYTTWETTDANLTTAFIHVCATYNEAATPVIYVNGVSKSVSQTSGTGTPALPVNDVNTYIGMHVGAAASRSHDGVIDEVGIWNRVLTAGEIQQLYNNGNGKTYPF